MKNNKHQPGHLSFVDMNLSSLLDPKNKLYDLSNKIDWSYFEEEFSVLYSDTGRPAKAIRLMVGLLFLKQLENLSDEMVVERWVQNPYYQYFCGEIEFQWQFPVAASDLVHFRHRIGPKGAEKLLTVSINLHGKKALEKEVFVDTTVQEKNITFPTDSKLHKKISEKSIKIAKDAGIKLRRTYKRTLTSLLQSQHNRSHPKRAKKARSAARRLKTIAGSLVRELRRKLPAEKLLKHKKELEIFEAVLAQTRKSKNKIYSLHETEVCCISKGKEHKKYEFGQKVSIAKTRKNGIIVGALLCENNPYDGHTLHEVFKQIQRLTGKNPQICSADRGYRGVTSIGEIQIKIPKPPKKKATQYEKYKERKRFRERAGIEPVISHLKHGFRAKRNFLKGLHGDSFNIIMAAAAYNLKKWLKSHSLYIFLQYYFHFKTMKT
ncbi:Transposase, IS4 family [hydrothermal vent metagenome]|uniref:Transposase, IS4 family n=1 Tax=hydrothermal vent metagenome TaxID=652676 RepID=A0A3B0XN11_9ZZZZ